MKRTPINRFSEKKIAQLNEEAPIRIALCKRAGGTPVTREVQIYRNGDKFTYTKVECHNGICECGCGQRSYLLDPHEDKNRSQGGKLSMGNTKMVTRSCHHRLQKSSPMWSKKGGHLK